MWKNLNKKVRIMVIAGGIAVVILAAAFIGSLALRVDVEEARKAALAASGGGEVVGQQIEKEGLWCEYSFDIVHDDTRYEVDVNAFGKVTELESHQQKNGSFCQLKSNIFPKTPIV